MSDRIDAHQPDLKLGNLGKRVVDRVFNGTDLGSDFEGGILKDLFAHGCSFPGAHRAGVAVGLI
jgi:hypothetical protein